MKVGLLTFKNDVKTEQMKKLKEQCVTKPKLRTYCTIINASQPQDYKKRHTNTVADPGFPVGGAWTR